MQQNLKKLERPVPGIAQGDHSRTRLVGYQEDLGHTDGQTSRGGIYHTGTSTPGAEQAEDIIYMRGSYFLLPEAFDCEETVSYTHLTLPTKRIV